MEELSGTAQIAIEIRPDAYELLVAGRRVGLTVREFQIFHVLAQRPDRVITRADIYGRVWGGAMVQRDRSVDVCVRKVRRKLAGVAPSVTFIHTHFGVGYRFSPEPAPGYEADGGPAQDAAPAPPEPASPA